MIQVMHDPIEALTLGRRLVVLVMVMTGGVIQMIDTPFILHDRSANLAVRRLSTAPAWSLPRDTLELGKG